MKVNKNIKALLIIFSVFIVGCNNSLTKINFNKGGNKLYFVNTNSFEEQQVPDSTLYKDFKVFCIDDISTLNRIQKNYTVPLNMSSRGDFSNCHYVLQMIKNQKLVWGGALDWQNGTIVGFNEKYAVNIEKLLRDSINFKKVPSFIITVGELETTKKLYELLIEHNAFMYGIQYFEENYLYTYTGEISLITDTSKININRPGNEINNEIIRDFENLCKVKMMSMNFDINEGPKIKITIWLEKDISDKIPGKYEIVEKFKLLENLKLIAIDIKEEELKKIIETNKLQGVTYNKI